MLFPKDTNNDLKINSERSHWKRQAEERERVYTTSNRNLVSRVHWELLHFTRSNSQKDSPGGKGWKVEPHFPKEVSSERTERCSASLVIEGVLIETSLSCSLGNGRCMWGQRGARLPCCWPVSCAVAPWAHCRSECWPSYLCCYDLGIICFSQSRTWFPELFFLCVGWLKKSSSHSIIFHVAKKLNQFPWQF